MSIFGCSQQLLNAFEVLKEEERISNSLAKE